MKLINILILALLFSASLFAADDLKVDTESKTDTKSPKKMDQPSIEIYDIGQTVLKMSLKKGVTADIAVESMLSKAAELNMKMVGHQKVSQELATRGIKTGRLEILQFCNPEDAVKMVKHDPIYAAYMPCRIALVEDKKGIVWLMMLNLDMLINSFPLPDDLRSLAITVNGTMLSIITAGSTGDF